MAGMISDAKFLGNDARDHGGGPDPRGKTIGHGSAVNEVIKLTQLGLAQFLGPARTMAFQQRLLPVSLVLLKPQRHPRTWRVEQARNLSAGVFPVTQQHRVQTPGDPVGSVLFGDPLERGELAGLFGR